MIHSRWFRLVVIVVLMVAGGLFLWQYNQVDKPQLVNSDGRVFEKARVVDIVRDNLQEDGSRVGDQIVTLRMEDGPDAGQTVQARRRKRSPYTGAILRKSFFPAPGNRESSPVYSKGSSSHRSAARKARHRKLRLQRKVIKSQRDQHAPQHLRQDIDRYLLPFFVLHLLHPPKACSYEKRFLLFIKKKERLQILIFPIIIRNRSCSYVFSIALRGEFRQSILFI